MKNIFLFLTLTFTLWACKKEEDPFVPGPVSGSAKCMLTEVEWVLYEGWSVKDIYRYNEDLQLIRQLYYEKGVFNKMYTFQYNSRGEPSMMLTSRDTSGIDTDTLATYEFEDGLLSRVNYYYGSSFPSSSTAFEYDRNGSLRKIRYGEEDNNAEINVFNDNNGNPVLLSFYRINGKVPDKKVEYEIQYDDKRNPYYHLPGEIYEWLYFAKNNALKIVTLTEGEISSTTNIKYFYREDHLIEKEIDGDGTGTDTTYYRYSCDQ